MCVISMVYDHYAPLIPNIHFDPSVPKPTIDPEALQRLIDQFNSAAEAAKTVDRLTGQPDCEDPAKVDVVRRVDRVQKMLDAVTLVAAELRGLSEGDRKRVLEFVRDLLEGS